MVALQAATGTIVDESFRARVRFFVMKAAIAVTTEAASATNHVLRLDLAREIVKSPSAYEGVFALAVMTNPTNLSKESFAAITDNDLEFTVNSVYDSFT